MRIRIELHRFVGVARVPRTSGAHKVEKSVAEPRQGLGFGGGIHDFISAKFFVHTIQIAHTRRFVAVTGPGGSGLDPIIHQQFNSRPIR